jgi:DNA-binding transcriptional LysR family regulator
MSPGITFELRRIGPRAVEDLDAGNLHLLVAPMHLSDIHPKEDLFADRFACIAWTKNRKVGKTITLSQYLQSGHVVVNVDDAGPIMFDEHFLRERNYKRNVDVAITKFDLAPELVVGTERIATVPTRLARKYARILPIKIVPLPVDMPPFIESMQWHRAHDQDPAHMWLRAQLRAAAPPAPKAHAATSPARTVRRTH